MSCGWIEDSTCSRVRHIDRQCILYKLPGGIRLWRARLKTLCCKKAHPLYNTSSPMTNHKTILKVNLTFPHLTFSICTCTCTFIFYIILFISFCVFYLNKMTWCNIYICHFPYISCICQHRGHETNVSGLFGSRMLQISIVHPWLLGTWVPQP